jgi:phosphatidate cytidylyltransferase
MNFLIRSLTSFLYVGLLLGSLYIDATLFSVVLFMMAVIAQWELQRITNKKIILSYLFFPAGYMIAQFTPESLPYLIMGLGVLGSVIVLSFFSSSNTSSYSLTVVYFLSLFQICIPLLLLAQLGKSNPIYALYFFGIIWLSDTGAYVIGSLLGKRKLAPTISPNKTIEGSLGGILVATASLLYAADIENFQYSWVLILVVTAILGVLGDLVQSKIKRVCGVKDSGNILPGHGGIYDRIDSSILAAPMYILLLNLFAYVS